MMCQLKTAGNGYLFVIFLIGISFVGYPSLVHGGHEKGCGHTETCLHETLFVFANMRCQFLSCASPHSIYCCSLFVVSIFIRGSSSWDHVGR